MAKVSKVTQDQHITHTTRAVRLTDPSGAVTYYVRPAKINLLRFGSLGDATMTVEGNTMEFGLAGTEVELVPLLFPDGFEQGPAGSGP